MHEALQVGRGHLRRHQHGIDAVAAEQVVEDLGRTHLGDRIAEDQEDAGGAGDLHRGEGWQTTGANDRNATVCKQDRTEANAR